MNSVLAILVTTPIVIVNPPTRVTSADDSADAAAWKIVENGGTYSDDGTTLRKGDTIARQRLVPKKLAVATGDIERDDGSDRWADAGDLLFGARVGDHEAYCVLKSKINLTFGMFLVPSMGKRVLKQDCFIDTNHDGLLDQRFEADPGIGVLPNVARSEPRAFYDLKPAGIAEIDPEEFEDDSWVELEFRDGGGRKNKPPELRVRYRYDGKTRHLTDRFVGEANFPSRVYLLGAEVEFQQGDDGKLVAQVIKPMNSSFGVVTSLVYR